MRGAHADRRVASTIDGYPPQYETCVHRCCALCATPSLVRPPRHATPCHSTSPATSCCSALLCSLVSPSPACLSLVARCPPAVGGGCLCNTSPCNSGLFRLLRCDCALRCAAVASPRTWPPSEEGGVRKEEDDGPTPRRVSIAGRVRDRGMAWPGHAEAAAGGAFSNWPPQPARTAVRRPSRPGQSRNS